MRRLMRQKKTSHETSHVVLSKYLMQTTSRVHITAPAKKTRRYAMHCLHKRHTINITMMMRKLSTMKVRITHHSGRTTKNTTVDQIQPNDPAFEIEAHAPWLSHPIQRVIRKPLSQKIPKLARHFHLKYTLSREPLYHL